MPEQSENTFAVRDLDPMIVHRAVLGNTPCCGFEKKGEGPWGIRVRALGDFLNPPASPSIQPGVDGIVSAVASAAVHLRGSGGEMRDVSNHFSALEHCRSVDYFNGLLGGGLECFKALDGEKGKYQLWSANEDAAPNPAYLRSTAPIGSKEELYFRSVHANFSEYALTFNKENQGVRQLGVEVVFWADESLLGSIEKGDELSLEIKFTDGSTIQSTVELLD